MQIFLVLALLVAILAVVFAVQNVALVSISFFAWNIQVSLAVALLAALGAGVLISILVSIPGRVKGSWNSVSKKKKYSSLEAERTSLQAKVNELTSERDRYIQQLEDSKNEIAKLEEELASLSAALQEGAKIPDVHPPSTAIQPEAGHPSETTTQPEEDAPAE